MANDFLFELGCEELPSAAVWPLADALATNFLALLEKAKIHYAGIKSFATPRRLAFLVSGLQDEQPSQIISRRGPALAAAYDAEGKPTAALLGFAKSCGVDVRDLVSSKTDKGEWLVHESTVKGAKTTELLPTMINQVLATLPIAKPMRWGNGDVEFARPIHWAVMLFGNEVIACDILGVKTGCHSYGHRFHHPQAIEIKKPQDYEALLQEAFVIADFSKRRALIVKQVEQIAKEQGAQAIMPDELLDEVTSIVEWPQALNASFDQDFLEVPAEALIASMQSHQKCFALQNSSGKLLANFITVSNIRSTNPKQVINGNEKVMRARLSDAAFFFRKDKELVLSDHIEATKKVVFQARLGSLYDKAKRMQGLMTYLASPLRLNEKEAQRAAELSKCDLLSGMVGEFPELQGLMGYYYAHHDNETEDVAIALNEQYMPRFAADQLPKTDLGLALSLVERLDTLVGIFAIGQKPSGVKDPFKLRRHALAVVRLLLATPVKLCLSELIEKTVTMYADTLPSEATVSLAELQPFILERMQSYYQSHNLGIDLVHAVRARQEDWLYDFDKRIKALAVFTRQPEAVVLSAACKRVNNLLQQAEQSGFSAIDEALLEEGAEKALYTHLHAMETIVQPLYATGDYGHILTQLASLREPVDAFFEHVMVMVNNKDVKMNRLSLLARLQTLLQGVADISLLQIDL